eukprot:CFRG3140T1
MRKYTSSQTFRIISICNYVNDRNGFITVSWLQNEIIKHRLYLDNLDMLVDILNKETPQGVAVLNLLHQIQKRRLPEIRMLYENLIRPLHDFVVENISKWVLYGLVDVAVPDFFISSNVADSSMPLKQTFHINSIRTSLNRSIRKNSASGSNRSEWALFEIKLEAIPCYMPLQLAEKILFIGKTIRVMKPDSSRDEQRLGTTFDKFRRTFTVKLDKLKTIATLQDNICALTRIIDDMHIQMSHLLKASLLDKSPLLHNLQTIKQVLFLADGEFYTTLFNHVGAKSTAKLSKSVLAHAFRKTVAECKIPMQFTINFAKKLTSSARAYPWKRFCIKYEPEWPTCLLLNDNAMSRYNHLHQLILTVNWVRMSVYHSWSWIGNKGRKKEPQDLAHRVRASGRLRFAMTSLLDNLYRHIHSDVLEREWNALIENIINISDFDKAQKAHNAFLFNITMKLSLHDVQVSQSMENILMMCFDASVMFCQEAVIYSYGDPVTGSKSPDIYELSNSFTREVTALTQKLVDGGDRRHQPLIAQMRSLQLPVINKPIPNRISEHSPIAAENISPATQPVPKRVLAHRNRDYARVGKKGSDKIVDHPVFKPSHLSPYKTA